MTASATNRWGHRLQGEVRVGISEGYTIGLKYGDGRPCDLAGGPFCHSRSPVMLDFAAGFGALEWLEIEARFRLGVESVYGIEPSPTQGLGLPMQAGLGIRTYGSETSRFKFAFGAAVLADFTSGHALDVVARVDEGIHFDVERHFAFYLQLGETIQPLRAMTFSIDGGLGVQGRFP